MPLAKGEYVYNPDTNALSNEVHRFFNQFQSPLFFIPYSLLPTPYSLLPTP
ncbi:MAG: hypothetical protein F6J99_13795 [Moorea sp. SIO4G3]|nr:hypothetical protein [Moorena sp. SIO4G3]